MKQHQISAIFLVAAAVLLALTFLPVFASERILDLFAREDGFFESLTAVYLFVISLLFAVAFFRFRKSSRLMRLSYAGLAALFFLGAGEETSWGERIFDLDDHNFIRGINVQGELTLHNLKFFQGEESVLPVSSSQLFFAFALLFAVVIPLACRLAPTIDARVSPHFPVLPLHAGVLVIITYIFQKSLLRILPIFPELYQHPSMPIPQSIHEIREHGYSLALLVSVAIYFSREWATRKAEAARAV